VRRRRRERKEKVKIKEVMQGNEARDKIIEMVL